MCYRPRFVSPPPVPSPAVSDFISPSPRFMSPPMTSPLSVSCTEGDTSFLHQSAPSSFNLPQQEQVDDLPDDMLSVLSDCYSESSVVSLSNFGNFIGFCSSGATPNVSATPNSATPSPSANSRSKVLKWVTDGFSCYTSTEDILKE